MSVKKVVCMVFEILISFQYLKIVKMWCKFICWYSQIICKKLGTILDLIGSIHTVCQLHGNTSRRTIIFHMVGIEKKISKC